MSAGATLLAVPGSDPDGALARALGKLETVLGVAADDAVDVQLGPVSADILEAVRTAQDRRRKVEIDYYSFGRDQRTRRVVQPWRVFNALGQWYLEGWCEVAVGHRLFRVDRISGATGPRRGRARAPRRRPARRRCSSPDPDDPSDRLGPRPGRSTGSPRAYPNEGVERTGWVGWCGSACAAPGGPGWSGCCCGPAPHAVGRGGGRLGRCGGGGQGARPRTVRYDSGRNGATCGEGPQPDRECSRRVATRVLRRG